MPGVFGFVAPAEDEYGAAFHDGRPLGRCMGRTTGEREVHSKQAKWVWPSPGNCITLEDRMLAVASQLVAAAASLSWHVDTSMTSSCTACLTSLQVAHHVEHPVVLRVAVCHDRPGAGGVCGIVQLHCSAERLKVAPGVLDALLDVLGSPTAPGVASNMSAWCACA